MPLVKQQRRLSLVATSTLKACAFLISAHVCPMELHGIFRSVVIEEKHSASLTLSNPDGLLWGRRVPTSRP